MERRPTGRLIAVLAAGIGLLLTHAVADAATSSPNDPAFVRGDQWALAGAPGSINAPAAWCLSAGAGVLIADIDTGADFAHPDLAGHLVPGARFTSGNGVGIAGAVDDDNGHGTRTAGIMVASANNGVGIAGVAHDARALVVKVLDSGGSGSPADVAAGIRYAVNYRGAGGERVRVINLSLGGDVPALLSGLLQGVDVQQAIAFAAQSDVAVAAAAGNAGNGLLASNDYAQLGGIALVSGAVDRTGAPAPYSTTGNIFAPGGDSSGGQDAQHEILSTVPGGYGIAEGTSFAAPHVAGVLAQLIGTGSYNAAGARSRILATASASGGVPRLDAAAALGGRGACSDTHAPRTGSGVAAPRRAHPAAVAVPAVATPTPAPPTPAPLLDVSVPPAAAGQSNAAKPQGRATAAGPAPDLRVTVGLAGGGLALLLAGAVLLGRRRLAGLRGRLHR